MTNPKRQLHIVSMKKLNRVTFRFSLARASLFVVEHLKESGYDFCVKIFVKHDVAQIRSAANGSISSY